MLHQSLAQGGEVEHAEGHADPFEDVLVAPPGFLQDAEGVLFLGDVAQHPDLPALEDLLAEGPGLVGERRIAGQRMAAEGERPRLAAHPQRQQLATGLAVATGVRQPAWLEVWQQAQQVMLAGLGRTDAEEAFGLGIEVAEAAVGAGHQHPLVDRRQCRGRLAQAALRGQGHGAQALLLAVQAQQHVHGDADQQEEDRQLAADSRQQAEPHSRAVVEPAKLPVAVAQRFHAEGLHVVEQRRAPWGMPEHPPGVLVFQAPEQVAGGQVGTPLGEAVAGQVQQPEATVAAAAGFAQGQVEGFAVARVEAIVVEAGAGVLAQLLGQRRFRRRAACLRGAVHPLQLADLWQRIADAWQQPVLDLATLAGGHAREQGEGGARLEFEGQGQAVVETIELGRGSLVFEAFLLAQLLAHLPEQQAEHQQDQQQQASLGCRSVGYGQWVAGGRRRRG